MVEGAVSASTDTGHANTANGGSFAMKPDGTINTALWNDFAQRGIHEMAVKTKALAAAFYGTPAEVRVLERLLHRRPPGPHGGAGEPGRLRRHPRRRAGHQLDQVHHGRAVPADRLPARPGRRAAHAGPAHADGQRRHQRLRRGERPASRLHPRPHAMPLRPAARFQRAVREQRRHGPGRQLRLVGPGAGDEQDLVRPDQRRLRAFALGGQRLHDHACDRSQPALVRAHARHQPDRSRGPRRPSPSRPTWWRSNCRTRPGPSPTSSTRSATARTAGRR